MNKLSRLSLAILLEFGLVATVSFSAVAAENSSTTTSATQKSDDSEGTLVVTAAEQTLQAPGVSTITADEIKKRPPARDVSEIVRTMPGVNLTGNSTSGQRGNNRQIDIRGMGPENTLILIDGMPVTSRNSVRQGWRGERDTRGDSNWVPPELIDHIEVIRGPAAARYGNGAAGGVVNIITKKDSTSEWHGSWNTYFNAPEHKSEGSTKRTNFSLTGPLGDDVSFRLYGGLSKTQADAQYINEGHQSLRTGTYADTVPAGREGSVNKDINGLLRWAFAPMQALEFKAGYSRQGNLYAGDTQNTNTSDLVQSKYGDETNRMYRQNFAVTWTGAWDNGISTKNFAQYENTRNSRINEGLAGGTEGIFSDGNFSNIQLDDVLLHSEVSIPFELLVNQTATFGAEWNQQRMKDNSSNTQSLSSTGAIDGISSTGRNPYSSAEIFSLFAEDNMELTDSTMLVPGLRFDHHTIAGNNWSPSLNLTQGLSDDFTLKMGIARAYKAPNLYQTNPNYVLYSRGQGCIDNTPCYLQGNADLKAETSINKEIGIEYKHEGYQAGLTWFRNDYRNKIEAGYTSTGTSTTGNVDIYKWHNVSKAVVEGLEGTVNIPVTDDISWNNNLTYMLQSKNKETGDRLSIIPEYTLNSTLAWQATQDLSLQSTFTWYGRQTPKKYNYQGKAVTDSGRAEVSPYSVLGMSGTYDVNKNVSVTLGIDNLFDKRHFRQGNAQTTGNSSTGAYMYGAGANTYNESGRTYYMSLNTQF